MIDYIRHPNIDPVMIHIGPFAIHWYGFMYLLAFSICYGLSKHYSRYSNSVINSQEIDNYFAYACLSLIVGGRLGYVIFYTYPQWTYDPIYIFRIWEGGMSFHGGLIGVIVYTFYFARKTHKKVLEITDFLVPLIPIGLALGRLGNFINGELWGRVAPEFRYAILFPSSHDQDLTYVSLHPEFQSIFQQLGMLPRYPSQLYEFFMEGVILFIAMYFVSRRNSCVGRVSGSFLLLYSLFRISGEFFREPDPQFTGEWVNFISMGQILSIPMLVGGLVLILSKCTQNNVNNKKVSK
ncbi:MULTISPECIES: prolipoprotein diacylglyceryl transferase [Enterobacterales]|uniref:prolipoprotein diacylglyceryl transferase n=1 Tax=Enterobacterales TaxID=91347 RepID=UPI001E29CA0B|nr:MULTISPECIES: prolipoprotein diacylglyceryl transferase [Klebsiella]MDD9640743.1 prolipoprotein diacylglyceryl transferase [Klebsiella michiganensis]